MRRMTEFFQGLLRQIRGGVESDYVATHLKNDEQTLHALAELPTFDGSCVRPLKERVQESDRKQQYSV